MSDKTKHISESAVTILQRQRWVLLFTGLGLLTLSALCFVFKFAFGGSGPL